MARSRRGRGGRRGLGNGLPLLLLLLGGEGKLSGLLGQGGRAGRDEGGRAGDVGRIVSEMLARGAGRGMPGRSPYEHGRRAGRHTVGAAPGGGGRAVWTNPDAVAAHHARAAVAAGGRAGGHPTGAVVEAIAVPDPGPLRHGVGAAPAAEPVRVAAGDLPSARRSREAAGRAVPEAAAAVPAGEPGCPGGADAAGVLCRGGDLVVRFELPGADPADIDVVVTVDAVAIRGVQVAPGAAYGTEDIRPVARDVVLPEAVLPHLARARYVGGALEVVLPRAASGPVAGRRVPVERV